mmetsp:Transcript_66817/g.186511  ORF Transcript_66817/g.186511 Transcript_66817/m.186511 type:complete len:497 (-) Transcript_66817:97-1587(-)|eukprot:CAMPEP_0117546696 /NCGR_PEP_ID=MMETSP0784-20121206/46738_1 /TAXON_ID=39447 /ORGANISM="" /LENGTH=496 /DNA_ID=CAMNT_0005343571 /DNA_START=121 /DNA_END=1611 /DNA_ORIENTATION=-
MAGAKSNGEFSFKPLPRSDLLGAAACPEEGWHKVFSFLSLREIARAASAILSSQVTRNAIGSVWDPHAVLPGPWPKGVGGLRPFLAAARATYLAEHVFCKVPRTSRAEDALERNRHCTPSAAITRGGAQPRSVVVSAEPSALAFSGGDEAGEGLLAMAIGRDIRLIRRDDMKSCGMLALAMPKGCREVGSMVFSPDSCTLAVVPRADSGTFAPEIQFYATEEKTKPVVTKIRSAALSGIDFMHGGVSASGGSGDLVAACGSDLCRVSPSTGDIVASWKGNGVPLAACKAVGPHEVIALADKTVEIWDLRTAGGAARSAKTSEAVTALDAGAFSSSSTTFLGDVLGGLHRVDWRGTDTAVAELLWNPAKSLEAAPPSHTVMVERGCVCLIAGPSLTMLGIDPCVVELGWADARGRLSAVAAGPGAWAFATQDPAARSAQSSVVIVDTSGCTRQFPSGKESPDAGAQKAEKKKKPKKVETQGKKPSCGKAAHGRNSGR